MTNKQLCGNYNNSFSRVRILTKDYKSAHENIVWFVECIISNNKYEQADYRIIEAVIPFIILLLLLLLPYK
jgi:hypothetical protein